MNNDEKNDFPLTARRVRELLDIDTNCLFYLSKLNIIEKYDGYRGCYSYISINRLIKFKQEYESITDGLKPTPTVYRAKFLTKKGPTKNAKKSCK